MIKKVNKYTNPGDDRDGENIGVKIGKW